MQIQMNTIMSIVVIYKAKAVLQDIEVYEENQESLALLKILAQSSASLGKKKFKPAKEVFSTIRDRLDK